MIPKGWKRTKLVDVCTPGGGLQTGPFGSQLHAFDYTETGVPVVMPKDLLAGRISQNSIAHISARRAEDLTKHRLRSGDIVFARRGDIGRCALVTAKEEGWICGTGCLRARPSNAVVPQFLAYTLGQSKTLSWLNSNAVGQTMLNLNTSILGALPLDLPPLPEQRQIAAVLGTWDEAIALTGRRIEAARRRKLGLMQRLLTGQVRFPGFAPSQVLQQSRLGQIPADWQVIQIQDVANVNAETAGSNSDFAHRYLYVDLSMVDRGSIKMPTERHRFTDLPSRARRVLHKGDVIMATVRPNLLGFAVCDSEPQDILCSTGFALISPKEPSDSQFIYQSLYGDTVVRQLQGLVTGSNYPAINASEVKTLRLSWPQSRDERTQIGAVLGACDREIELLTQKQDALRRQKKGLMQRLLTGRVRVSV